MTPPHLQRQQQWLSMMVTSQQLPRTRPLSPPVPLTAHRATAAQQMKRPKRLQRCLRHPKPPPRLQHSPQLPYLHPQSPIMLLTRTRISRARYGVELAARAYQPCQYPRFHVTVKDYDVLGRCLMQCK